MTAARRPLQRRHVRRLELSPETFVLLNEAMRRHQNDPDKADAIAKVANWKLDDLEF